MRPSDLLLDIGRPVAFYPGLVKHLGSVNAVLFFGQIFYWQDKAESDLGVYKSVEEIEEETGLTYREQQTARKQLVERRVLIETHKRLEHRIYYRIDTDALNERLGGCNSRTAESAFGEQSEARCAERLPPTAESAFGEVREAQGASAESAVREVRKPQPVITTETTTETTQKPSGYPPEFEEAWAAYPKRAGGNPKKDALKSWNARLNDKDRPRTAEEMIEGVKRYARYCDAAEKTGTEYVMQAVRFFGASEHFAYDWTPPPKVTPRNGRPSMNQIHTDPAGDEDGDLFDGKHFRKAKRNEHSRPD